MPRNRRLAILECEDAKKWEGYTESLWKEALHEPGVEWSIYKACEGELPSPAEAATYDAIVIGGSHYSAYEEHDWISKMLEVLPQYAAQGTRMYGCCFGCQILARALGGSVGTNPDGKFVLTLEQIQPTQELQQFTELLNVVQQALADACTVDSNPVSSNSSKSTAVQSAQPQQSNASTAADGEQKAAGVESVVDGLQEMQLSCSKGCFRLIESHGDQVLTLPPGAIRLATSPTAPNELWCYGPNILASQFHVEFDEPLVLEKIWKFLKDVGRLNEQQAEESRKILESGGQQNAYMLQVIKYFLKHGIPGVPPVAASNNSNGNDSSNVGPSNIAGPSDGDSSSSSSNGKAGNAGSNGESSSHSSRSVASGGGNGSNTTQGSNQDGQQQQQQYWLTPAVNPAATAGDSVASNRESGSSSSGAQAPGSRPTVLLGAARSTSIDPDPSIPGVVDHTTSSTAAGSSSTAAGGSSTAGGVSPVTTHLRASLLPAADSLVHPSGASSPTAMSEHSIATATSTSSAIPFSHIAYQRRQQEREEGLAEASQRLINDASASFDLRMDCYNWDLETLQQLNNVAAEQYSSTAEIATALCQFVADLDVRQAAAREALAVLPQVDRQLKLLEHAVGQLDKRSRDLESKLGLGKSSAYDYLASTFTRAGSSVSAAAMYAAGGGGCLGGVPAAKQ